MARQIIDTSLTPEVTIQSVGGDLSVRGWESPQVAVNAEPDSLQLGGSEDHVTISGEGDIDLRLPHTALLHIDSVDGDASIKNIVEQVHIREISGSLDLRQVGGATIGEVSGNLSLKGAHDDVTIRSINGNADLRSVTGSCRLASVDGNLELQNIDGDVEAAVEGNARLRLERVTGERCTIAAEGNIYCYLPEDADAQLTLVSGGETIKVRMGDGSRTYQQGSLDLTLGGGTALVSLTAEGTLYLFVERFGWSEGGEPGAGLPDNFGQQIAQQVESQIRSQMDQVTRQLSDQMSQLSERLNRAGLSPEETDRIVQDAMRSSERETQRAQEKMRRAQEKLERKLEAQQRKIEARTQSADRRSRRSWGFEWGTPRPPAPPPPPAPPAPPAPDPVTVEERLMILRMLEQKKISLEEADRLLAALEGKD
ncbi:MAG: SHOCT-like domain-containing protein [Chloroflexota bacterium]